MCPSARFYFSFCKHTREITGCLVPASILSEFSVSLLQPTHTSFEAAMWWKRAWYEERALFTYNHFHDWSRCVLSLFILHIIFTPQHKHQKMHGWPKFIITFKRIKYSLIDRNRIKLPASGFLASYINTIQVRCHDKPLSRVRCTSQRPMHNCLYVFFHFINYAKMGTNKINLSFFVFLVVVSAVTKNIWRYNISTLFVHWMVKCLVVTRLLSAAVCLIINGFIYKLDQKIKPSPVRPNSVTCSPVPTNKEISSDHSFPRVCLLLSRAGTTFFLFFYDSLCNVAVFEQTSCCWF